MLGTGCFRATQEQLPDLRRPLFICFGEITFSFLDEILTSALTTCKPTAGPQPKQGHYNWIWILNEEIKRQKWLMFHPLQQQCFNKLSTPWPSSWILPSALWTSLDSCPSPACSLAFSWLLRVPDKLMTQLLHLHSPKSLPELCR